MGFLEQFINWIIDYGGLYVLLLVVFAETGLLVGFLFPGDSMFEAVLIIFLASCAFAFVQWWRGPDIPMS